MRGVIEHYVDPVSAIENVSKILETKTLTSGKYTSIDFITHK